MNLKHASESRVAGRPCFRGGLTIICPLRSEKMRLTHESRTFANRRGEDPARTIYRSASRNEKVKEGCRVASFHHTCTSDPPKISDDLSPPWFIERVSSTYHVVFNSRVCSPPASYPFSHFSQEKGEIESRPIAPRV